MAVLNFSARCGRGGWQRQCLEGCGFALHWFPRVAIPLVLLWGSLSHIRYASRIGCVPLRLPVALVGVAGGALAMIAYVMVWHEGAGTPLEFEELAVGDEEQRLGPVGSVNGDQSGAPSTTGLPVPPILEDSVEARYDGSVRFCRKCNVFKPDRTHHCRQCGVCVLRMDHHCPWFTTCVGLRNHKFFLQFLWYSWVLCFPAMCVGVPALVHYIRSHEYYYSRIEINLVFYTVLSSMFTVVITCFGSYCMWYAAQNCTTLESMEPAPYRTSLPASQWRFRYPPSRDNLGNIYDLGRKQNLEQIFGSTWREWLLPVRPKLRYDGRFFPYNHDLRAIAEERAKTEIAMHERKRMNANAMQSI